MNRALSTVVLAIAIPCIGAVTSVASPSIDLLTERWGTANSLCRGGPGDSDKTVAACKDRDQLHEELERQGRCYGKEGQFGYQKQWHACGITSLRTGLSELRVGAWAYIDPNFPKLSQEACAAYKKHGLKNLSGNAVGELVVFLPTKRLYFGGYADTESTHLSVKVDTNGIISFRDRWYEDGEGGARPGNRTKTYSVTFLAPNRIQIIEGKAQAQYMQCNDSVSPAIAAAPAKNEVSSLSPNRIGQCFKTKISKITDRFGAALGSKESSGTIVVFVNGLSQVSYDMETAIGRSKIGDDVNICLKSKPAGCPPGDDRGKIYTTQNLRTGEAWTLSDSQHSCGGA